MFTTISKYHTAIIPIFECIHKPPTSDRFLLMGPFLLSRFLNWALDVLDYQDYITLLSLMKRDVQLLRKHLIGASLSLIHQIFMAIIMIMKSWLER